MKCCDYVEDGVRAADPPPLGPPALAPHGGRDGSRTRRFEGREQLLLLLLGLLLLLQLLPLLLSHPLWEGRLIYWAERVVTEAPLHKGRGVVLKIASGGGRGPPLLCLGLDLAQSCMPSSHHQQGKV